jgi:hypothetical protein
MIGPDVFILKMFNDSILWFEHKTCARDKCDTFAFLRDEGFRHEGTKNIGTKGRRHEGEMQRKRRRHRGTEDAGTEGWRHGGGRLEAHF